MCGAPLDDWDNGGYVDGLLHMQWVIFLKELVQF